MVAVQPSRSHSLVFFTTWALRHTPLGAASLFYGCLPFTIPWIQPHAAFAHPLDDGTAVVLEHSIEETIDQLDACDRKAYRSVIEPVVSNFAVLVEEILGPILHIPRSPFVLARFGLSVLASRASDFVTGATIRVDGGYSIR